LSDRMYKEVIHKDYRDKIDATIRKRGHDPDEFDAEERLSYCDLGALGQITLNRYSSFQSILKVNAPVFEAQLAWMNAYRSGHAAVHTGDTQKYVSLMGRGAMGHYSKVFGRYLETRLTSASTQPAGGSA